MQLAKLSHGNNVNTSRATFRFDTSVFRRNFFGGKNIMVAERHIIIECVEVATGRRYTQALVLQSPRRKTYR